MEVDFEEIKPFFIRNKIWMTEQETYWYEGMWNILATQKLTTYEDDWERYEVILRAVVLYIIYAEFTNLAFDERYDLDSISDYMEELIPEFALGQLYRATSDHNTSDMDYALASAAESKREEVMEAIKKELGILDMYLSLMSVHKTFVDENDDEVIFDSAEEFWKTFHEQEEDIYDEYTEGNWDLVEAYSWLVTDGAPSQNLCTERGYQ